MSCKKNVLCFQSHYVERFVEFFQTRSGPPYLSLENPVQTVNVAPILNRYQEQLQFPLRLLSCYSKSAGSTQPTSHIGHFFDNFKRINTVKSCSTRIRSNIDRTTFGIESKIPPTLFFGRFKQTKA